MSIAATTIQESGASPPPELGTAPGPYRRTVVVIGIVLAAQLPFLVLHLWNLWRYRPHYQFFPVVLAAVAWLVWRRWPAEWVEYTRQSRILAWLMLLGLTILTGAVLLYSPWLGAIAAVLSVGGVLLALKGQASLRELTSAWLLLWLVIPPPWRLDDELIRVFQSFTARTTSALLESIQINHLLAGNVFRLPDRELFVAEACSGVHTPLLLIAISLLWAVVWRRRLLHAAVLVAASVCCAATVNTARVLLIVLAAARWGVDLSVGWQHEVLGYCLVGLGVLLLLSADQLLVALLAPVLRRRRAESDPDFDPETDALPAARDPLSRVWNRLVARYPSNQPRRPAAPLHPPPSGRAVSNWIPIAVAVAFACLGVLQVVILLTASYAPGIHAQQLAASFQESWLPQRVGQWERKDYRAEQRDHTSDEGQFSRTWVFQAADQTASVSVDYPFFGWHELTRYYQARGWTEVSRAVRAESETGPYVAVQLSKANGESGYLLFSLFDGTAEPVPPGSTHGIGLRGKPARSPLPALLGFGDGAASPNQTNLQIQQFIAGGYPLDRPQRETAEQMYLDFRRRLLSRWQTDTAAE